MVDAFTEERAPASGDSAPTDDESGFWTSRRRMDDAEPLTSRSFAGATFRKGMDDFEPLTVRSLAGTTDGSPVLNRTFGSLEEMREFDRMHAARTDTPAKLGDDFSCSTRDDSGSIGTGDDLDGRGPQSLDAVRRSYESQISSIVQQWQLDVRRADSLQAQLAETERRPEKPRSAESAWREKSGHTRPHIPRLPLRELSGNVEEPQLRQSEACFATAPNVEPRVPQLRESDPRFATAPNMELRRRRSLDEPSEPDMRDELRHRGRSCDTRRRLSREVSFMGEENHPPAQMWHGAGSERRGRCYADPYEQCETPRRIEVRSARSHSREVGRVWRPIEESPVSPDLRPQRREDVEHRQDIPARSVSRDVARSRGRNERSLSRREPSARAHEAALEKVRQENELLRAQMQVVCTQVMRSQETPVTVLVAACALLFCALLLSLFA